MVCVLLSHTYHVTHHVTVTYDTCDVTLSHTPFSIVSPREKKRKENINNNLVVLPSHNK